MQTDQKEQALNAYVDGELTPEQSAKVERLLERDEESRRTVAEIRKLRACLGAMPRFSVGCDLTETVLSNAVDVRPTPASISPDTRVAESPTRWGSIRRRLAKPRVWAYPVIVAIMAIALSQLFPGGGDDQQLASSNNPEVTEPGTTDPTPTAPAGQGHESGVGAPTAAGASVTRQSPGDAVMTASPEATLTITAKITLETATSQEIDQILGVLSLPYAKESKPALGQVVYDCTVPEAHVELLLNALREDETLLLNAEYPNEDATAKATAAEGDIVGLHLELTIAK